MKVFTGKLIEAGSDEDGTPRIVFEVTREQLTGWPLPFYRDMTITVDDTQHPDPLADHPSLF